MEKKKLVTGSLLILLVGVLIGLNIPQDIINISSPSKEYIIKADCTGGLVGSGSMLPMMDKGDKIYERYVGEDEILWLGRIYIYEKNETATIIHRLVGFADDDQQKLIFQGDNNDFVDPLIDREQVKKEVVGICFRRGLCP